MNTNCEDANVNGSLPTAAESIEQPTNRERERETRNVMSMTPEKPSPVEELAATPEDEEEDEDQGSPDPDDLTDEFLGQLQAAGLFEHCDTRKIEKFMMRLDSLVSTLLD
jgi:hypothetical protein